MTHLRAPLLWPVLAGGVAAAAGSVWVACSFTHKAYALGYHVPLAFLTTAVLVDCIVQARSTRQLGIFWAGALAAGLITGRMIHDWPWSGHGILGALYAASPLRPGWRILGAATIIQSAITKSVRGERPLDALWGACVGVALHLVAVVVDRRRTAIIPKTGAKP